MQQNIPQNTHSQTLNKKRGDGQGVKKKKMSISILFYVTIFFGTISLLHYNKVDLHDDTIASAFSNSLSSVERYEREEVDERVVVPSFIIPNEASITNNNSFLNDLRRVIKPPKKIIVLMRDTADTSSDSLKKISHSDYQKNTNTEDSLPVAISSLHSGNVDNKRLLDITVNSLHSILQQTQIIPIVVGDNVSRKTLEAFVHDLSSECYECTLVASLDFSHYQPALLAELHDSLTARVLRMMKLDDIFEKIEVDSPGALWIAVAWAKKHNANHFNFYTYLNSAAFTGKHDTRDTVSHIVGWYGSGKEYSSPPSVTFSMVGDFMFARGIHKKFKYHPTKALGDIGKRFFRGTDASIANLEGAISNNINTPVSKSGTFRFVFPPTTTELLKDYNINTVSLANNHSLNNGRSGLRITRKILSKQGIEYFGGPTDESISDVSILEGNKLNIVMIGVHMLVTQPDITPIIRKYAKDPKNRVVVMPHWGAEYHFVHSASQKQYAHRWVNAGADLVVGAHPHVVQDAEVYNGVPIIYSLGNFLFDQTERTTQEIGVQDGMTLHGEFTKDNLTLFFLPIELRNLRPHIIINSKKKKNMLKPFMKSLNKHKVKTFAGNVFVF